MDQKPHSALQFKQYSAISKSSFPNKNQTWHINIITTLIFTNIKAEIYPYKLIKRLQAVISLFSKRLQMTS